MKYFYKLLSIASLCAFFWSCSSNEDSVIQIPNASDITLSVGDNIDFLRGTAVVDLTVSNASGFSFSLENIKVSSGATVVDADAEVNGNTMTLSFDSKEFEDGVQLFTFTGNIVGADDLSENALSYDFEVEVDNYLPPYYYEPGYVGSLDYVHYETGSVEENNLRLVEYSNHSIYVYFTDANKNRISDVYNVNDLTEELKVSIPEENREREFYKVEVIAHDFDNIALSNGIEELFRRKNLSFYKVNSTDADLTSYLVEEEEEEEEEIEYKTIYFASVDYGSLKYYRTSNFKSLPSPSENIKLFYEHKVRATLDPSNRALDYVTFYTQNRDRGVSCISSLYNDGDTVFLTVADMKQYITLKSTIENYQFNAVFEQDGVDYFHRHVLRLFSNSTFVYFFYNIKDHSPKAYGTTFTDTNNNTTTKYTSNAQSISAVTIKDVSGHSSTFDNNTFSLTNTDFLADDDLITVDAIIDGAENEDNRIVEPTIRYSTTATNEVNFDFSGGIDADNILNGTFDNIGNTVNINTVRTTYESNKHKYEEGYFKVTVEDNL